MKKLMSIVLAFMMIFSVISTASAETIKNLTDSFVPNPLEFEELSVDIFNRESGNGEYITDTLMLTIDDYDEVMGVDYKTTLDMEPIRTLFDRNFISSVLDKKDAMAEFENGTVKTTVTVLITYPAGAAINGDLNTVGGLVSDNGIFQEVSRNVDESSRSVTITYKNTDNLKVSTLLSDVDKYLADLTFELKDVVTYKDSGEYLVTVTLSGSTVIDFDSLDQKVVYTGQGSQYVHVTKDISITNHVLEAVPSKAPTCFEPGWTQGTKCSVHDSYNCGAKGIVEPKRIEPYNHEIDGESLIHTVTGYAATCTHTGLTEHRTCSLCKTDFDMNNEIQTHEYFIISKLPHTTVIDPGFAATCIKPGYEDGSHCGVCGKTLEARKVINPTDANHKNVVTIGTDKAPTCTEDGSASGQKCNDCGKIFKSETLIPALGHDFGEWEVVTAATETAEGKKQRVCKNDASHIETSVIPKLAHETHIADPAKDVVVPATCTTEGKKTQYCYYCDTVVNEEVIPALGHKLSHIAAIPATCSSKGTYEHYKCEVCNVRYRDAAATKEFVSGEEPINPNNHPADDPNSAERQRIVIKGVRPTCLADGLTDGLKCKACNKVLEAQKVIPKVVIHTQAEFVKAGHSSDYFNNIMETVAGKAAACEKPGVVEHKHCKLCNGDFNEKGEFMSESEFTIAAKEHEYEDAVIPEGAVPENGYYTGTRKCKNCDNIIEVLIPLDKENCEHKVLIGDHITESILWHETKAATCTQTGLKEKICSFCDEVLETVEIEKLPHDLVKIPQVEPTCREEGTVGYWLCLVCDKMFDATDVSLEITEPEKLEKTEYDFRIIGNGNNKQCRYCKEVVHIKTKDKDGHDKDDIGVKVDKHGHIKHDEEDIKKAEVLEEENKHDDKNKVEIISTVTIQEKEDVSPELDKGIPEKAAKEKVVVDIIVEKVTTYSEKVEGSQDEYVVKDEDKEEVKETDDLITFEITIPESMRAMTDFIVHRLHDGKTEKITTKENRYGEYIEIDKTNWKVILHVRRFSEYALVGYEEVVNPPESGPVAGSSSSIFTIKLNSNGGTKLDSISARAGEKITLPTPVREGYVFAGWYTDNNFTKAFDTDAGVTGNLNLYAKWVEVGECRGIEEDRCPHLNYTDINPELWYHRGVDYVLNNKMMIGVAANEFAPDWAVTRAMLVTAIWRAEGKPSATVDSTFTDLEDGLYYVDAVKWAAEKGIVTGYSDEVFAPNDNLAREQIAAIFYRYAGYKGYDVSAGENTNILSYTDSSDISEYAIGAMQYTAGTGLITGRTETTLNPKADTTRAEIATILYRFFTSNK